jgi:hypothetical protein
MLRPFCRLVRRIENEQKMDQKVCLKGFCGSESGIVTLHLDVIGYA